MADNERELQRAVARGLEACGFPNPTRYFTIQTGRRWLPDGTPVLVVRLRLHELRVQVRNFAQTMSPTAEMVLYHPETYAPEELAVWARDTAAADGLTVLYAEVVRCRTCKGTGKRAVMDLLMPGRPRYIQCEPCLGKGRGGPDSFDWPKEWPSVEPTGEVVKINRPGPN